VEEDKDVETDKNEEREEAADNPNDEKR